MQLKFNSNLVMKSVRPQIASWRAFVDGKQIGCSYVSESEALDAAQDYIENMAGGHTLPEIDIKPSFVPVRELV